MTLPRPNEEELKPYNKHMYFNRLLLDLNLTTKLNVTAHQLGDWISENYDSVYLYNKELNFKK
jgi:hypothetical protein